MAGNVKKGFGTYLLILLLSVVAAFLIICVVMIFQPFKVIMGYKYFTYGETTPFEYQLTTDNTDINFREKDIIRISSNYANIKIEKNPRVEDEVAVVVRSNAKGFAKSAQNTDFSYSISTSIEDGKKILDISVKEPQGSLFFQKDIEIDFYVPYYDTTNGSHDISGKEFIITTQSGSVFIGNQKAVNEENSSKTHSLSNINPSNLTVQTGSGQVYIYPNINSTNLENLTLRTQSGNIKIFDSLTISRALAMHTESGTITAKTLDCMGENEVTLNNGKLIADIFKGKLNLTIKNGELNVTNIYGSLISNNASISASNARIIVDNVSKDVSLPFLGNSYVLIGKIGGQAYLEGEGANINLKEIAGESWVKTTTGSIYVYTTGKDVFAQSTTGEIEVFYASNVIANDIKFASTKGQINLHLLPSLSYKMNVYDLNGSLRTNDVKVEPFEEYSNPLVVNSGINEIIFTSNGKINVSLFTLSA